MAAFYVKIRYRGKLSNPNTVYHLISETEDICKSNGWTYKVWEESWEEPSTLSLGGPGGGLSFEGHAPLKGISFSMGKSESIWLTFTPDGILQSLFTLVNPVFFLNDPDFPWQRVKTGYDGAKSHIALCKLFRYLSDKYFEVFEVLDETEYWGKQNDAELTEWMDGAIRDEKLLDEEMAAIDANTSLTKEQRYEMSMRLIKEFGEKYRVNK